jgi:hypothetical protein
MAWIVLCSAPAAADLPAYGWVDVADPSWVKGWARDDDCVGCAVWVHFYVDGVYRGATLANQSRIDVGPHAFNFAVPPLPSGAHSMIAYAIGLTSSGTVAGSNPPLGPARTFSTQERRADFNGDGVTELAVYRRSDGGWWVNNVYGDLHWGVAEDVPVAADYDGDGHTDIAVYRPSNATWYVLRSADWTADVRGPYGGGSPRLADGGHVPVPGDYNGDGRAEPAVFRTTDSTWHAWGVYSNVQWGVAGDIPVPGDYDGDGRTDIAVFRPSNGTWYAILSGSGQAAILAAWGVRGDIPVPADYDGDGRTDMAVFRPSTGAWWVINSATGSNGIRAVFGAAGDVPTPADFNGDRLADVAVFRPSNGTWYVAGYGTWQYGLPGDIPVSHQLQYFQAVAPTCSGNVAVGAACDGGVCCSSGKCSAEFLRAGQSLLPGQCRSSPNGRFQLCYGADGLLDFTENGTSLWSQPESGASPGRVTLQANGNLVVSDGAGGTIWESGDLSAALQGVPALQVLDTGEVVIDDENNLDGLLDPPTPPSNSAAATCDIELHTRNANGLPLGAHDVVHVIWRDGHGGASTQYLNMQGGAKLGCDKVTCNKESQYDSCDNKQGLDHDTHKTWERRGLSQNLCHACVDAYLADIGYDYSIADSNGAVNDCMDAIRRLQPSFKGPPLVSFVHWWDPVFRFGRHYEFPGQGHKSPPKRCRDAIVNLTCDGLTNSSCPMICGSVETHKCEVCPTIRECAPCDYDPTFCGCPGELGHDGSCGSIDACDHVFGSANDPGCPPPACQPTTSCAQEGATCGSIWNGCASVDCGTCGSGYECTPEHQCACVDNPDKTCGWVTQCGWWMYLGDCDPNDCIDDFTGARTEYCCASTCGEHPNDVCQRDGTCTCIPTCEYPAGCGQADGCGHTCSAQCGPCGDSDGDCYDDCTWDWVCEGDGPTWCSTHPGWWMCGGPIVVQP